MAGGRLLVFEKLGSDWVAWYRRAAWLLRCDSSGQWAVHYLAPGEKAWARVPGSTYPTVGAAAVFARTLVDAKPKRKAG